MLIACAFTGVGYWAWPYRYHWIENNFREIEPGRVYAGGYQYPGPLTRILQTHRIKTVLSLLPEGTDDDLREQQVVAAMGVEFKRITIPTKDSGDHISQTSEVFIPSKLASVQEAVAILSDTQNQPVFVHCQCGRHRVGSVIAVYRVQHCGWREAAARAELVKWGGLQPGTGWPATVLHEFCQKEPQILSRPLHDSDSNPGRADQLTGRF